MDPKERRDEQQNNDLILLRAETQTLRAHIEALEAEVEWGRNKLIGLENVILEMKVEFAQQIGETRWVASILMVMVATIIAWAIMKIGGC